MIRSGATFKEIADVLGHASLKTTAIYAKLDLAALIAAHGSKKYELHDRYLNQQLVRMLRVIGYDVDYKSAKGAYLFDSHDAQVPDAVWNLYRTAVERFGAVPSLIEWDDNIPELDVLVGESRKAASIEGEVLRRAAG